MAVKVVKIPRGNKAAKTRSDDMVRVPKQKPVVASNRVVKASRPLQSAQR